MSLGVGVAFFGDAFQAPEVPFLEHTKLIAPCLKVAPTGEHGSPFLTAAAFASGAFRRNAILITIATFYNFVMR